MLKISHNLKLRLLYAIVSVFLNTYALGLFGIVSHLDEIILNQSQTSFWKFVIVEVVIAFLIFICGCSVIWLQAKYRSGDKFTNNKFSTKFLKDSRRELLSAVREDIESRIRITLPKQELMHLEIKPERKDSRKKDSVHINCYWKFIESNDVSSQYKKIIEVFNTRANERLLILGHPGAGKTTMLLKLGEYLINEAKKEQNKPIPVIFDMTTWEPDQEIFNWLACRLKIKYNMSEELAKEWLTNHQVLPLLDSLDQQKENQTQCIDAINRFLRQDNKRLLVICCRFDEYEKSNSRLLLTTAAIGKINKGQIEDYLNKHEQEDLLIKLTDNSNLIEFINNPLKFKLLIEASSKIEVIENFEPISIEDREQFYLYEFFEANINHKLQNEESGEYQNEKYNIQQVKKWLAWLANTLQQQKQKEFLIEKMQPSWLENSYQKPLYRVCFGIISAVIFGLIFSLISGLISELFSDHKDYIVGFVSTFASMIISVMIYGDINEVFLVDGLKFSWFSIGGFWKNRVELMIWTLFAIFLTQPLYYSQLFYSNGDDKHRGLIFLTISWLTTVMLNAFFSINYNEIKSQKYPNQGIQDSAETAFFIMLITLPLFALVYIFMLGFNLSDINQDLHVLKIKDLPFLKIKALIFGFCCGLFFSLIFGGIAVIQHFIIRFILWHNGDIPWNYSSFLEEMAEREMIFKIGGRYHFMHELLREHFTKMQTENSSKT